MANQVEGLGRVCIGFGEREGVCENPPDLQLNHAGLWCTACERERRSSITQQMAKITAAFDKEEEGQ